MSISHSFVSGVETVFTAFFFNIFQLHINYNLHHFFNMLFIIAQASEIISSFFLQAWDYTVYLRPLFADNAHYECLETVVTFFSRNENYYSWFSFVFFHIHSSGMERSFGEKERWTNRSGRMEFGNVKSDDNRFEVKKSKSMIVWAVINRIKKQSSVMWKRISRCKNTIVSTPYHVSI